MNALATRSLRLLGTPAPRLFILEKANCPQRLANWSRSRWSTSASFVGSPYDSTSQKSSAKAQQKPKRLSGFALVLGTAASSAAAFGTALSIQSGVSLAEYSSTAAPVPTSAHEENGKSYDGPNIEITLYQYEVCPFCNKVRAYLDYHNIPYKVVEVDPLRKTEMKQFSEDYRKVPIAVVDGKQVNGSASIIDHVNTVVKGETAKLAQAEQKWVEWVDNYFVHLISPNIYRTVGESLQTFEYIADNAKFSAWQRASIRYSGAAVMYMVGKKLKKKYDIGDERAAMNDAVKDWIDAVEEKGGKFLAGNDGPGIADLSVYGVLKAIQTFDTFSDVRKKNAAFCEWYDRTQAAVGDTSITERA